MAKGSLFGDAAVAAACGIGATWLMTQAGKRLTSVGSEETLAAEKTAGENSGPPATVNAAKALASRFGASVEGREELAGNLVHYAYGAAWGAAFGIVSHHRGWRWWAGGLGLGTFLWLVGDEVLVPLLGWAKGPDAYPATTHAKALASHLVYGVGLAGAREAVRAMR